MWRFGSRRRSGHPVGRMRASGRACPLGLSPRSRCGSSGHSPDARLSPPLAAAAHRRTAPSNSSLGCSVAVSPTGRLSRHARRLHREDVTGIFARNQRAALTLPHVRLVSSVLISKFGSVGDLHATVGRGEGQERVCITKSRFVGFRYTNSPGLGFAQREPTAATAPLRDVGLPPHPTMEAVFGKR